MYVFTEDQLIMNLCDSYDSDSYCLLVAHINTVYGATTWSQQKQQVSNSH